MANALTKDLEIYFEKFVEGFDAACVLSRAVETSYPRPQAMQRAGETFYVPQAYQADVTDGLDVSAAPLTDVIQRQIPVVYRSPQNVIYEFDAKELRDPMHKQKMGEAAALRLSAEVDKNLYSAVAKNASMVVKKVGAISWDDGATAEALMISRGITNPDRKFFFNAWDYKDIAKDLGNKAYMSDWSKDAYARAQVPDIATFQTFRTDNQSVLAAVGTVTGTTVTANTAHTVTAMTGDVPTDNRYGTLGVSGANIANIKNGDSFTIAGVNVVHNIEKGDTGQLQTFRVVSGGGTATLTVTPKIIVSGPYQNVTAQAAAGAAITFLNTVSKPVNVFFTRGAVTLDYGRLEFPNDGQTVMTATTKQGVPLSVVAQANAKTGKVFIRNTLIYAAAVRDPEKCGIVIANQT